MSTFEVPNTDLINAKDATYKKLTTGAALIANGEDDFDSTEEYVEALVQSLTDVICEFLVLADKNDNDIAQDFFNEFPEWFAVVEDNTGEDLAF